jgi:hypothetical protein
VGRITGLRMVRLPANYLFLVATGSKPPE